MHSLYFVMLKPEEADNAKEAIGQAEDWLNSNDFANQDGYYSSGKCDWFQMGGRWSGLFSELTWAKQAHAEIDKLEKDNDIQLLGCHYGDKAKTAKQAKLLKQAEEIWAKYRPAGLDVVYNRDMYSSQEDDAVRLTKEVAEALIEKYGKESHIEIMDTDNYEEISLELLLNHIEDYAGNWLVVVDYHN